MRPASYTASGCSSGCAKLAVETHLVISRWGARTLLHETPYSREQVEALAHTVVRAERHGCGDFERVVRDSDGMIIAPCSARTLGAIAHGFGDSLIHRAADVVLKERRKLVLAVREAPLSDIHLENMLKLSRMGAVILPPVPAFYNNPRSLDDIVEHTVARMLDQFGVEVPGAARWEGNMRVGGVTVRSAIYGASEFVVSGPLQARPRSQLVIRLATYLRGAPVPERARRRRPPASPLPLRRRRGALRPVPFRPRPRPSPVRAASASCSFLVSLARAAAFLSAALGPRLVPLRLLAASVAASRIAAVAAASRSRRSASSFRFRSSGLSFLSARRTPTLRYERQHAVWAVAADVERSERPEGTSDASASKPGGSMSLVSRPAAGVASLLP